MFGFIQSRYGESDGLPPVVRKRLETLPLVMSKLEATQTASSHLQQS